MYQGDNIIPTLQPSCNVFDVLNVLQGKCIIYVFVMKNNARLVG